MDPKSKITTGANDRPRNESIAQTGPGLPDDSGGPPEASEEQAARVRRQMAAGGGSAADQPRQTGANPDRVPEGTPESAENLCRRCAGTGKVDGGVCPDCGGAGTIITPVGGAG